MLTRSAFAIGWWVACGGAVACGKTERPPDTAPTAGGGNVSAGTAQGGGAMGGSRSSAGSAGTGGSGAGISGGGAGGGGAVGGSGGGGGGGGAVEPSKFGLIVGDDACPPVAPTGPSCPRDNLSCVYRGIASGLSEIGTVHCGCASGSWQCVRSDEDGNTACPATMPSHGGRCLAGAVCLYALLAQNAVAGCYCTAVDTSAESGAGGAGGSAGEGGAAGSDGLGEGTWFCGV